MSTPLDARRVCARRRAPITLAATLLMVALSACASAPPPPTEAMSAWRLERARSTEIAVSQPDEVARADAAYRRAEAAHADGHAATRTHELRLADIHWRTAVTRYQLELDAAALARTRAALAEKQAALAAIEDETDALRAEIVGDRGQAVTAGARPMPTNERAKAEYALDTAVVDLGRADEVGAESRAPLLYTKAALAYDAAASLYGAGRYTESVERAAEATRLARNAYEEALPRQREARLQARLAARRDEMLTRLLRVATPIVSEDDISVSLVNYFGGDGDTVRSSKAATLDALAEIVRAFPEYSVQLVGHTDVAGHPTDNLMLSQAQALAIRQALEDRGVDRNRLTSIGEGASAAIEVDRGEVANARVDVIFEPRKLELVEATVGSARRLR